MATTTSYVRDDRLIRVEGDVTSGIVASGDTVVATIPISGSTRLAFHFGVTTQALDNFDVFVKAHPSATSTDITPSNWASLTAGQRFLFSSGNLAAQAAATSGYFEMDVTGLSEVVIKVSAAVNGAVFTPYWSLQ